MTVKEKKTHFCPQSRSAIFLLPGDRKNLSALEARARRAAPMGSKENWRHDSLPSQFSHVIINYYT